MRCNLKTEWGRGVEVEVEGPQPSTISRVSRCRLQSAAWVLVERHPHFLTWTPLLLIHGHPPHASLIGQYFQESMFLCFRSQGGATMSFHLYVVSPMSTQDLVHPEETKRSSTLPSGSPYIESHTVPPTSTTRQNGMSKPRDISIAPDMTEP